MESILAQNWSVVNISTTETFQPVNFGFMYGCVSVLSAHALQISFGKLGSLVYES